MRFYQVDLLNLGTPCLSWRRFANLLRFLPRESAIVQEIRGEEARWGDSEYLMALLGDSVAHLGWMYARVHARNAPNRPPRPILRPGEIVSTVPGMTVDLNLPERTAITAAALSLQEMDAAVARQTGTARGIVEVD